MPRYIAAFAFALGVVAIVVGGVLQATGAAAVVFCSVIGGGIILAIAAAVTWLVQTFRQHGTPHAAA